MPKARRKPRAPALPVEWVDNPQQNAGCVVEEIREPGKAIRKRRTRETELHRIRREGRISGEQFEAGQKLAEAYLETLRTPAPQEKVDRTPRPDERTLVQVEALHAYGRAMAILPHGTIHEVVHWVCCRDMPVRGKSEGREVGIARNGREAFFYWQSLTIGLTILADQWKR